MKQQIRAALTKVKSLQHAGTLKTLALSKINGQPRWTETVIDLDKIICVNEYPFDDYPHTSFLKYSDNYAMHVDVPLKQMRKILDEHKRHGVDASCNTPKPLK